MAPILSDEALQRALAAAGVSAPVRWDEATGSTNETAMRLAVEGAPAWTLVAAGHQTAGRGRGDRVWSDRPGRALLFSLVVRPAWDSERLGLVALAAGAAMADAAAEASGADVRCKWPNDLLVEGSKVGGILGEAVVADDGVQHAVIGVGVNLEPPPDVADAAGIGDVDPEALLTAFLIRFRVLLEGEPTVVLERWRERSATIGRLVEATVTGGDALRGIAVDLDERGGLVVLTDEGPATVTFGDVAHLDQS
jgi:BirA family transcriptional regulator, biotin operon repressor / biotin---[acetyl-CoA-carboxylase] ligase